MEWTAGEIMKLAIGFFFVVFGIGAVFAFLHLGAVLKRLASILTDANTRVIPLLTRVETTLDEVNAELSKVDDITGSVVHIVRAAEHTTTAVHGAVAKPLKKLAGVAAGVSGGISSFFSGPKEET